MGLETLGTDRDKQWLGKRKIENLQALRGVAILLVLIYHLWRYEDWYLGGHAILPGFAFLGRAGVDLFFVISGFVMTTITQGRFQRKDGTKTFLLRRIARIYPLYWFYTLIYLAIFLVRPDMMKRGEGTEGIGLLQSFLLLPGHQAPLLGQGWTLIYEMFFYTVFALILLRPEREKLRIFGVWASVIVILNVLFRFTHLPGNSPLLQLISNFLNLEFLAGCLIAVLASRGINRYPAQGLVLGIIAAALTLLLPSTWDRALVYILPASLIVYGAITLESARGICFPRWLRFVGDISYSLYLSHMLVLSVVLKALSPLQANSPVLTHVLFICLASAAALAFGALSYFWIESNRSGRAMVMLRLGPRKLLEGRGARTEQVHRAVSPHTPL